MKLLFGARIRNRNPRATCFQEQRGSHAGLSQSDHQHALAFYIDSIHRLGHCVTNKMNLAQLQRSKSKKCKHQSGDPEAGDHLRL